MTHQHRSPIALQKTPAGNAGLTQAGKAFRIRKRDGKTDECAVFRCRCGRTEVYSLWAVRSGKTVSCGCKRGRGLQPKYQADWQLMRLRHEHGITVEPAWRDDDEMAGCRAIIDELGPCPDGMVIAMIDATLGYIARNCGWSWPETAMKQQQTMAMQRMAAAGSKSDALWNAESARIERARQKRINDFPIFEGDIPCCPLCQGKNLKPLFRRASFRKYRCNECARTFRIRRPIE